MLIGLFVAAFILAFAAALPLILGMLERAGHVAVNFRGQHIPVSLGISFHIVGIPLSFFAVSSGHAALESVLWPSFLLLSVGLVGLADDAFGSRSERGLRGHLGALVVGGRLSTGGLKAIFGLVVSFITAFAIDTRPLPLIINGLMIALFINFSNLLDLRPGRACKGYLLGFVILLLIAPGWDRLYYLAPLTGVLFAYLPLDLRARAMMGDVGSNTLGAALGYGFAIAAPPVAKIIALLFLLLIHIIAERWSLSEIIEGNAMLRFLDMLGRH